MNLFDAIVKSGVITVDGSVVTSLEWFENEVTDEDYKPQNFDGQQRPKTAEGHLLVPACRLTTSGYTIVVMNQQVELEDNGMVEEVEDWEDGIQHSRYELQFIVGHFLTERDVS